MSCANCRKVAFRKDSGGENVSFLEYILLKSEESEGCEAEKMSITDVIGILFEASLKLHKKQIASTCRLKMCSECASRISDLHVAYLKFMGLTKEGSYIQQLIQTSVLWPSIGENLINDHGGNLDYSNDVPFVETKLEIEDLEIPITLQEDDDPDPEFVCADSDGHGVKFEEEEQFPFLRRSTRLSSVYRREDREENGKRRPATRVSPISSNSRQKSSASKRTSKGKTSHHAIQKKEPIHCPHNCVASTPFRSKESLKLHLKSVHNEVVTYPCPTCGKSFRSRHRFGEHVKYKHAEGLTPAELEGRECTICSKVYSTKCELRIHTSAVHATQKTLECHFEGCGKRFVSKNYLRMHQYTHYQKAEGIQFPCETCGKALSSKQRLQRHINVVHLDQRNSVCEICGRRFARPEALKNHMSVHDMNRERQWECKVCKQAFLSAKTLKSHAITHTESRDQCCYHCGKTFLHVHSLHRHLHTQHGENQATRGAASKSAHTCQQCGKSFKIFEYLRQHLRSRTHGGMGHRAQKKKNSLE